MILFVVGAAAGIPLLLGSAPAIRRLGVRLVFVAIGSLLGEATILRLAQTRSSTGLPLQTVSAYELELTDDSVRGRSGEVFHRGRLIGVYAGDGTAASAAGRIVLTGGRQTFTWGEHLTVAAPLTRAPDGGWRGRCIESQLTAHGRGHSYFRLRNAAREWVEQRLAPLPSDDRALFMALFLGARDDLDGSEVYFFRRSGCIHLLALSGFHLGLLSFLLLAVLGPLLGKRRGAAVAALLLSGYLFVAGPKVSLLRAVLMFGLLGGCRLAAIRVRGTDLLGVTFLLCLFAWPQSLRTLSFELSYLALAGIMIMSPPLDAAWATCLPRFLRAPASASVGAQLATAPLLASCFGCLYPVGLASTLALTPLVTAFLWSGLAVVLLPLPPALMRTVAVVLDVIHRAIVTCAEYFARAEPVRVDRVWPVLIGCGGAAICYAAVFALRLVAIRRRRRRNTPIRRSIGGREL